MNAVLFRFCVLAVAGWIHRGQQSVIEYLVAENRVPSKGRLDGRTGERLVARYRASGSHSPLRADLHQRRGTAERWRRSIARSRASSQTLSAGVVARLLTSMGRPGLEPGTDGL